MAGSEAEERIRAKAEAYLRANYGDARIIHELVLDQGGCRIDLAAVGRDYMVLVEIKSERDTLDRLEGQLKASLLLSTKVVLCLAAKKVEPVLAMQDRWTGRMVGHSFEPNPKYMGELRRCSILAEQEDGELRAPQGYYRHRTDWIVNPQDLLSMLWADELRAVCYDMGVGKTATRNYCITRACEILSGREVRRRVCRELRSRPFPRADAKMEDPRE